MIELTTVGVSRSAGDFSWVVLCSMPEDTKIVVVASIVMAGKADPEGFSTLTRLLDNRSVTSVRLTLPRQLTDVIQIQARKNLVAAGKTVGGQAERMESRRLSAEIKIGMVYEVLDKYREYEPKLFADKERAYAFAYGLLRDFGVTDLRLPSADYVIHTLGMPLNRNLIALQTLTTKLKKKKLIVRSF